MAGQLEQFINNIGICAIDYLNAKLKDSRQPLLSHDAFLALSTEVAISDFVNTNIKQVCHGSHDNSDITGRQVHLQYMFDVYKYARLALLRGMQNQADDWTNLETALATFMEKFDALFYADTQVEFKGQVYELTTLRHQNKLDGALAAITTRTTIGSLGLKFREFIRPQFADGMPLKTKITCWVQQYRQNLLQEHMPQLLQIWAQTGETATTLTMMTEALADLTTRLSALEQKNQQLAAENIELKREVSKIAPLTEALQSFGLLQASKEEHHQANSSQSPSEAEIEKALSDSLKAF